MTDQEKREKAITGLECCLAVTMCGVCPYNDDRELWCGNNDTLLEDALAMLKAQEPVEPLRINHDTKWQRDTEYICGECCGSFCRLKVNFCPWCGKAVKWDD